jgi:hypothetical protein
MFLITYLGGKMSLSLALAINSVFVVALLGFLGWMMSHPRHLTPHSSQREACGMTEEGSAESLDVAA